MRSPITEPLRAKKGDLVIVSMRLQRSQSDARLSLWSAYAGDALSPHIQNSVLGVLVQGRPGMHHPMYTRLTSQRRKATWQFKAEEDLTFVLIQDRDTKDEPLARARIRAHGTTYQAVRRFVLNAFGLYRGRTKPRIGGAA